MTDMTGRVCLITGSTNGIGLVTAEALAKLGAEVILHGRDPARLRAAVVHVRERSGFDRVRGYVADFTSLESVRRLANEINAERGGLHVLVNNAGVLSLGRKTTKDGFELHFGVNHLAHFLLTNLVLDKLKASGPARIVCVASVAHMRRPIDLDDLEAKRVGAGLSVYGRSKFANILFAKELGRRLPAGPVTANALHPGLVATGMLTAPRPPLSWVMAAARLIAMPAEEGAKTSIYLASSSEVAGVTGKYFVKSREAPAAPLTDDRELARRLWDKSAQLVGIA